MSQSLQAQAAAIADKYTPPASNGRHSAIADEATVETLLRGFRSGLNDRDCCLAAGINPRTLTRWYEIAEQQPDSAQALFVDALKRERANGKLARLQRIERAADDPKYWASNAWILERTDPEQFALRKEDSQVPQIVVHAEGAREIKIGIIQPNTFASSASHGVALSQSEAKEGSGAKLLSGNAFANVSSPITAIMVTSGESVPAPASEPDREIAAVESAGGPYPVGGSAGGQSTAPVVKGRPTLKEKKAKVVRGKARAGA